MDKQPQRVILIIDDQEDDRGVLTWQLGKLSIGNRLIQLEDGHEAICYLTGQGRYADLLQFPFPAAMFLDLQMPVVDGWQVLDWIHGTGLKGQMRIFVHSTPKNVEEVNRLYYLGIDSFLKKPLQESELRNLIEHFPEPWESIESQ